MYITEVNLQSFSAQNQLVYHMKLPDKNLRIDPRASISSTDNQSFNQCCEIRFLCRYSNRGRTVTLTNDSESVRVIGHTVTLTNINSESVRVINGSMYFRVYNPNIETVPDFNSNVYTYKGLDYESAPANTVLAFIDPAATIVKSYAFKNCYKMRRCVFHEDIKKVESDAFLNCRSMDALFLPKKLKNFKYEALNGCDNVRAMTLPPVVDIEDNTSAIWAQYSVPKLLESCKVNQNTQSNQNRDSNVLVSMRNHMALVDFYSNLPPLYLKCLSMDVTAKAIEKCIVNHGISDVFTNKYGGMTPLHILTLNPHSDTSTIMTCWKIHKIAAFITDDFGYTPIDNLCLYHGNFGSIVAIISHMCTNWCTLSLSPKKECRIHTKTEYLVKRRKL